MTIFKIDNQTVSRMFFHAIVCATPPFDATQDKEKLQVFKEF